MSFIERQRRGAGQDPLAGPPVDPVTAKRLPALWEYLTATAWPDGAVREVATLLLFTEDGVWKACLNDRANDRTCWVSGSTFPEVLQLMEEELASGDAQWRSKPRVPGKKK